MIFRYAESCRSLSWSMLATSCLTPAAYMSCYLALYLDDLRIFRPGLKRQGPAWETRQSCWWGHQNLALQELVYISHDVFDAYRKSHYKAGCHLGVLAEICEMCYTMLHHPQLNMEPDEGYFKVQCWRLGCVWGRGLSMFSPKISFFLFDELIPPGVISSYILQILVVHLRDIEGRLQKLVSIVANLVNVYGPVQQAAKTDWAVFWLMHWASLLQRTHPVDVWESAHDNDTWICWVDFSQIFGMGQHLFWIHILGDIGFDS